MSACVRVCACSAELQEDWYHSEDPVNAGVTFYVKVAVRRKGTRRGGRRVVCKFSIGNCCLLQLD